jgi:hypothetical protein
LPSNSNETIEEHAGGTWTEQPPSTTVPFPVRQKYNSEKDQQNAQENIPPHGETKGFGT